MINIAGLEIHPAYILAIFGGIVWLIRVEDLTKQNKKDIERLEKHVDALQELNAETNKEMLKAIKELQKSFNELNTKIETVMVRIEHMNKKITFLESVKLKPFIDEYFKDE